MPILLKKRAHGFSYNGERIGQGREMQKKFLIENPAVASTIENAVRENAGLVAEAMLVGPDVEDEVDDWY